MNIQTEASPIASVPAWLGEVALVAHTMTRLSYVHISERVRFARKRFGLYEVIDFLAVLIGYALSGEPTLAAYYQASPRVLSSLWRCSDAVSYLIAPRSVAFSRPWMKLGRRLRTVFLQDALAHPD